MRTKRVNRKPLNKSFIPNLFTMINMFLGFSAIILLQKGNPILACWLILWAMAFDAIDGKTARKLGISNQFGTEFDSFADTVSFGVFPALLIYKLYTPGMPPLVGEFISFFPLLFGTIRLARFNLMQSNPHPYYTGLTTPLNTLMIASYVLFSFQLNGRFGDPRVALPMAIMLSFLMISRVRFAKFPAFTFKLSRSNNLRLIGLAIILVTIIFWRGLIIFPLFVLYISWSVINWILDHDRLANEIIVPQSSEE